MTTAHTDALPFSQSADHRRQAVGVALVVLSTVSIGIVPTLARLAYDGGSDTLTVVAARGVITTVAAWLVALVLRQPLALGRAATAGSLLLGIVYGVHVYCLLGAVNTLPVNLVILLFYLHPLMIGVCAMLLGRDSVSPAKLAALAVAMIGLVLAVGLSKAVLDPRGIALALVAAILAGVVIVGSARVMRGCNGFAVTSHMSLSASVTLIAACLYQGDIHLPITGTGWLGFTGVAVAYTIGTLTFFAAVPVLGAIRAAMISNLEPIFGIVFALAILGEAISPLQGLGIILVLGAILAMERLHHRSRT